VDIIPKFTLKNRDILYVFIFIEPKCNVWPKREKVRFGPKIDPVFFGDYIHIRNCISHLDQSILGQMLHFCVFVPFAVSMLFCIAEGRGGDREHFF
jgi:hypothetical protein